MLCALDVKSGGLGRLMTGECHHALLGQFGVAELRHAAMTAGIERDVRAELHREIVFAQAAEASHLRPAQRWLLTVAYIERDDDMAARLGRSNAY